MCRLTPSWPATRASVVAYRFTEDERRDLEALRWWDWPEDVILERVEGLNGTDVAGFLDRFGEPPAAAVLDGR